MTFRKHVRPKPKNGRFYRGPVISRISKETQNEKCLDEQSMLGTKKAKAEYGSNIKIDDISSQGSGERLDREEYLEVLEKAESGEYDVIICEDLGRIVRRLEAVMLCEIAEDSETRVLAINDHVDTLDGNWRQTATFAALRHEAYNEDTSRRIRRSLEGRFEVGLLPLRPIAGYEIIDEGRQLLEENIRPSELARKIVPEIFSRLNDGQSLERVAEWLNEVGFSLGPYVKKTRWDGTLVGQYVRNKLLMGVRIKNNRTTKRNNKTGRRKSMKAPEEMRRSREVPHLAVVSKETWTLVNQKLHDANACYRNGIVKARTQRSTRRDTRWPGQHLKCGICGRPFVLGGHGDRERMMCDGARKYLCYNAMSIDRPQLAAMVADKVRDMIVNLPDFDSEWGDALEQEARELNSGLNAKITQLRGQIQTQERKAENLAHSVANGNHSPTIARMLEDAETAVINLSCEVEQLEAELEDELEIPTADEIRELANAAFLSLAIESHDFGDKMRRLITEFHVYPHQLFDGGRIEPRCKFTVDLKNLFGVHLPSDIDALQFQCGVDITTDPQRVQFTTQVWDRIQANAKQRDVAAELRITQTAVQKTLYFERDRRQRDLSAPWCLVRDVQTAAEQYKRVRHSKFRFEPRAGFPRIP